MEYSENFLGLGYHVWLSTHDARPSAAESDNNSL